MKVVVMIDKLKKLPTGAEAALEVELIRRLSQNYDDCKLIVRRAGSDGLTLPVKTIESNTGLTLVSNYTGPNQSGAAWSAAPRVALNMVTAALVTQSAEALRGLNYDKQNWQQVFSGRF